MAGIHRSIAEKIAAMARGITLEKEIVIIGGGALDIGLVKAIEEKLAVKVVVPDNRGSWLPSAQLSWHAKNIPQHNIKRQVVQMTKDKNYWIGVLTMQSISPASGQAIMRATFCAPTTLPCRCLLDTLHRIQSAGQP